MSVLRALLMLVVATIPASSQADSGFASSIVEAHNCYRTQVSAPPLVLSARLASRARQWALLLINENRFVPRRDGLFGENLYEMSGGASSPASVVSAWVSERKNYNHRTNTCNARCGHYTQVVWRDTKLVGCGVARNKTREVWVCNYDPPGNVVGERPY